MHRGDHRRGDTAGGTSEYHWAFRMIVLEPVPVPFALMASCSPPVQDIEKVWELVALCSCSGPSPCRH